MTRPISNNTIIAIVAFIALLFVVFRHPKTQAEVTNAYDSVADTLLSLYVLYFEPIKEATTAKEASDMKKTLDSIVSSYQTYIEKDLGNKVKHKYDATIHGLSILLDLTTQLLKALGKKATGKASKGDEIVVDKLYELLYKLKGEDLKKWGIQMKLEKDKKMFASI